MTYHRRPDEGPQPPYPMRPVGPTYHGLVDRLMGRSDRHLIDCTVCGYAMMATERGAHEACLGNTPEPYQAPGPYLGLGLLVDSTPWMAGIVRAATEAEAAKAAEALKAAMPITDSPLSPEPKPKMSLEDEAELHAVERKIAAATRRLHQCAICRRPMIAMQQIAHATCTSPGEAWRGWSLPTSRKRKAEGGEVTLTSSLPDQGPMWTDWAAALAAVGLIDRATIPDR